MLFIAKLSPSQAKSKEESVTPALSKLTQLTRILHPKATYLSALQNRLILYFLSFSVDWLESGLMRTFISHKVTTTLRKPTTMTHYENEDYPPLPHLTQ